MPYRLLALAVAVLVSVPLLWAQEDPAELIADLAAEEFETRQAAREKLLALGQTAVLALTAAANTADDPEVRVVAGQILQAIAAADLFQPSLVSVNVDQRPLVEVARALSEQIPGSIVVEKGKGPDNARVSLKLQRQPLWDALREMQLQTGYRVHEYGRPGSIVLQPERTWVHPDAPSRIHGPFLFVINKASRRSAIEFTKEQKASDDLTLDLRLLAEPKSEVLAVANTPNLDRLEDGQGRSLLKEEPRKGTNHWVIEGRRTIYEFTIPIPQPNGRVRKISKLQGRLPARIVTESAILEFPHILAAEGKTFSSEHWNIKVNEVKWDGKYAAVIIAATLREGVDKTSGPRDLHYQRFRLVDNEGIPLFRTGYSGGGAGKTVKATLNFRVETLGGNKRPGEPAKLIYSYPAKVVERTIPFAFEDLPLP